MIPIPWIRNDLSHLLGLSLILILFPNFTKQHFDGVIAQELNLSVGQQADLAHPISSLSDGNYQFCSETEPQDWSSGAGVCFWFRKVQDHIVGYYGYPNSDDFVNCLEGTINQNQVLGKAVIISWGGQGWSDIPQNKFAWDEEGNLQLNQGQIIHSIKSEEGDMDWIQFAEADLNLTGFYYYSSAKSSEMKPPSSSCDLEQLLQ